MTPATRTTPLLTVRDLSVDRGGSRVLDGIDLQVEAGEFVSIVGPSGCGKSTLLAALMGEVASDAGTLEVASEADSDHPPFAWMPQSDSLLPWRRVMGNATIGLEVAGVERGQAEAIVEPLLGPFGLNGRERAWPDELSGGMRQRLALLRTVALGRPLLLLDEPFGALDALTRSQMQEWLDSMRRDFGWTVVLITHDVREAVVLSDRVLVLSPRPATITAEVPIALQYPRSESMVLAPECAGVEAELLGLLSRGAR